MPRWPKRKPRPGIDEYGRTPLWYHAFRGDLSAVRAAIESGADVNAGDDVNYTPLHVAVQEGRVQVIDTLLAAGADPNAVDNHGNSPLWTSVLTAPKDLRVEIITKLLGAVRSHTFRTATGKARTISPWKSATASRCRSAAVRREPHNQPMLWTAPRRVESLSLV